MMRESGSPLGFSIARLVGVTCPGVRRTNKVQARRLPRHATEADNGGSVPLPLGTQAMEVFMKAVIADQNQSPTAGVDGTMPAHWSLATLSLSMLMPSLET